MIRIRDLSCTASQHQYSSQSRCSARDAPVTVQRRVLPPPGMCSTSAVEPVHLDPSAAG